MPVLSIAPRPIRVAVLARHEAPHDPVTLGGLIEEPGDRGTAGSLLLALRHGLDVVRRSGRRAIVSIRSERPGRQTVGAGEPVRLADPAPAVVGIVGAERLWQTAARWLPDWTRRFDVLRRVLRAVREGRASREHARLALAHIYLVDERADLEREFLRHAEVTVLSPGSRRAGGPPAGCFRAHSRSRAVG